VSWRFKIQIFFIYLFIFVCELPPVCGSRRARNSGGIDLVCGALKSKVADVNAACRPKRIKVQSVVHCHRHALGIPLGHSQRTRSGNNRAAGGYPLVGNSRSGTLVGLGTRAKGDTPAAGKSWIERKARGTGRQGGAIIDCDDASRVRDGIATKGDDCGDVFLPGAEEWG